MNRWVESVGMLMIGDAVLALVRPTEHCLMWSGGPRWWRETVDWFADHPDVTRGVAAAELGAGLWLALQQHPEVTSDTVAEIEPARVS
jgi:hypothetical protein